MNPKIMNKLTPSDWYCKGAWLQAWAWPGGALQRSSVQHSMKTSWNKRRFIRLKDEYKIFNMCWRYWKFFLTDLIPLAVKKQLPWLEEYLLTVSGARVDVLLYDAPICQLDSDTVIKQANNIKLCLNWINWGPGIV